MPREIITDWVLPSGRPGATVMYFDLDGAIATQRSAVADFWNAFDNRMNSTVRWTVRVEGRELNQTSGAVTGYWGETSSKTGLGGDASAAVLPDATQALVRWYSDVVIGGRRLQGRTFIPGLTAASSTSGNLSTATLNEIQVAANALVAVPDGLNIWHRPVNGVGGSDAAVETARVWSEFAVLRRRRTR